ncbi:hypothetical protein FRC00_013506, partial [Tulasnella sp. 408]
MRTLSALAYRQSTRPSTIPTDQVIEAWIHTATDEYFQANSVDASNDALFAVFLLHIILLPYIAIGDRLQKPVILHPDLESTLRSHVLPKIFDALNQGFMTDGAKRRPDIDGRIFLNLLGVFAGYSDSSGDLARLLGRDAADAAGLAAGALHRHVETGRLSFSPSMLSIALGKWHYNEVAALPLLQEKPVMTLLPFHNDAFDECLKPIRFASQAPPSATASSDSSGSSIADGTEASSGTGRWFTNSTIFTDDQHWHNNRKIEEGFKERKLVLYGEKLDYGPPLNKWQLARRKRNKEREHQERMRDIHRNATTLTGAKGAPLQRLVIPATKMAVKDLFANKLPVQRRSNLPPLQEHPKPKKEPKSKQPKLNSTERLRQQIKQEKATKLLSASEAWWKQQLANMETLPTLERKVEHLSGIQRNAKRMEDPWLRTEALLYQVHLSVSRWIYDSGSEDPQVQAQYCVSILRAASDIHSIGVASDAAKKFLCSLLETIGFSGLDIVKSFSVKSTETPKNLLTFQPVRFAHRDRTKPPLYPFLQLPSHPIDFQLEHYGLYMDRSMDGQVDAR